MTRLKPPCRYKPENHFFGAPREKALKHTTKMPISRRTRTKRHFWFVLWGGRFLILRLGLNPRIILTSLWLISPQRELPVGRCAFSSVCPRRAFLHKASINTFPCTIYDQEQFKLTLRIRRESHCWLSYGMIITRRREFWTTRALFSSTKCATKESHLGLSWVLTTPTLLIVGPDIRCEAPPPRPLKHGRTILQWLPIMDLDKRS